MKLGWESLTSGLYYLQYPIEKFDMLFILGKRINLTTYMKFYLDKLGLAGSHWHVVWYVSDCIVIACLYFFNYNKTGQ